MSEPTSRIPESQPVIDVETALPIGIARPIFLNSPAITRRSSEMLLLQSSRTAAWVDIGLLLTAMIVFEIIVGSLIGERLSTGPPEAAPAGASPDLPFKREWLVPLLSARAVVASVTILSLVALRGQTFGSIGLRSRNLATDALLGFATAAFAGALVVVIMLILTLLWGGLREQMEENAKRISEMVPHLSVAGFVFLALVIGAYEELVFRGFLMTRLRRGIGNWALAIIVSSSLFTALHAGDQEPAAMIAITVLALLFSAVTIWRRSIAPATVAHTAWNLAQFMFLSYYEGDQWR